MKLNLVIDASGIYYRSLFTVGNFGGGKKEKLLDTKKSQGVFMRKLATDFSSIVRSLDEPARVIVCLDSSSWRKSVLIEEGGYKINREEKDETAINWNAFYEMTDKFASVLSQKGYIISKVPGAEADDLLFFWSEKLNNMGENVVLVTGDRDLLQVVGKHSNGSWTVALDPVLNRKKISLTQETLDYTGESDNSVADIFQPDSWSSGSDVLEKIIKNHEINIVDPEKIKTMKVVLGDNGDDVPSVVTWRDKKDPEKIRTMTENNYGKILAAAPSLEKSSWKNLLTGEFDEVIASTMENLKKIEIDRSLLKENIIRNAKLVILSHETIPKQIYESFESLHAEVPDVIAVTGREALLNGTEWWSSDPTTYVPKSYDLFGD